MKSSITNIVSVADLQQEVNLSLLNRYDWGLYDLDIYPAGYIKDGMIQGKVIVFHSGKMISAGAKTIRASFYNLDHAKALMVGAQLIEDVKLRPKVRNMVATSDFGHGIDLIRLARTLPDAIYEPEQFPGLIFRPKGFPATFLLFSSGKVVIAGATSESEVAFAATFLSRHVTG